MFGRNTEKRYSADDAHEILETALEAFELTQEIAAQSDWDKVLDQIHRFWDDGEPVPADVIEKARRLFEGGLLR